jgi:transcription elongation factor Elf1
LKNLKLEKCDVVEYCKNKILSENVQVYKKWKNRYCEVENMKITINSYSYTIITVHMI